VTWLDSLTLDTVIVHTVGGMSFKGNLVSTYADSMVLRDARVLEDENMSKILDGEAVIPREQVLFIQKLPADPA
jgi:small nuclear ribonucleoprotein (snRNP)-like protein